MKGIWTSLAAAALMVFTPALQAAEIGQPGNGRNAGSGGCPNCPSSGVPLHDGKGPHGMRAAKQGHGMGKAGRAQGGGAAQGRRGMGPRDGTGMSKRGWDPQKNGRPGWGGGGGGRGRMR